MRPMQWVRLWVMPHFSDDSSWKILDLRQRGFFDGMLVLAGRSNNGGEICCDGMPGVPYTDEQLASSMCISVDEFRSVLSTIPADMVFRKPNGCLQVTNWANYQTEYERRKGYKTKLHPKVTPQSNTTLSDFQKSEVRSQKSEEQKDKDSAPGAALQPRVLSVQQQAVKECLDAYVAGYLQAVGREYDGKPPVGSVVRWLGQQSTRELGVKTFQHAVDVAIEAHKIDPSGKYAYPQRVPLFTSMISDLLGNWTERARNAARVKREIAEKRVNVKGAYVPRDQR